MQGFFWKKTQDEANFFEMLVSPKLIQTQVEEAKFWAMTVSLKLVQIQEEEAASLIQKNQEQLL
jgi:hypothetical protein